MIKDFGLKNIITFIFVIGAIVSLLIFSGLIKFGADKNKASGTVVVWGTIPFSTIQQYIDQSKTKNLNIIYKTQDKTTYESDLVNALASGSGPDLFIMPHENILRNSDKIFKIPYSSFPQGLYEATYINESKLFLTRNGILAIPMSVDPLIMYYNKNLVASSFLIDVPKYWDEFTSFVTDVTIVGENGKIVVSGAALGTYENILNAKGLLSTLLMQNDNKIVGTDPITTKKRSELAVTDLSFRKAEQVLTFFTSFSQFGNKNYSWNEALRSSREKFISGELAIYFGKASEVEIIRKKNPNLDFDVALMPQISKTSTKITYGSMNGIAITKSSKNIAASIEVASKLAGSKVSEKLNRDLLLTPARKDLLRNKPNDSRLTLFYNSAIISNAWIDPDMEATEDLFRNLIRSINTGSLNISDALRRSNSDLNKILNRTINTTIVDISTEMNN